MATIELSDRELALLIAATDRAAETTADNDHDDEADEYDRLQLRLKSLAMTHEDTICECGHWYEEHSGSCDAPGCTCSTFVYSAEASTPEAIADRGGDPELWPQRVKDALLINGTHD